MSPSRPVVLCSLEHHVGARAESGVMIGAAEVSSLLGGAWACPMSTNETLRPASGHA